MSERLTEADLKDLAQRQAEGGPQPGEVYRHYKGGVYSIVARAIKEDDLSSLVIYHSNKKGTNWARTLVDFTEPVPVHDEVGIRHVPRFTRVED
jgi:hypothetical protein